MSISRLLLAIISISILSACGGGKSDDKPAALPQSNAGISQNVQELDIVTLDGSGSVANNSNAITFQWSQSSGTTVTLSSTTVEKPTFTAPDLLADETLVFQLVVGNGVKNSLPSTVDINVSANNDIPTANAGTNQTENEGTLITLDGSLSSDPEGQTLTFSWSQTLGTTVTLSSATASQPTFTLPKVIADEILEFRLVVNDGTNNSSPASVQITNVNVSHAVVIDRELMVTDLSVVESVHTQPGGKWTFEHLITEMMPQAIPTDQNKTTFVLTWLNHWLSSQTVNTFSVPTRNAMQTNIITPWLNASLANGKAPGVLDLSIAPFRLLSIVNRMDLAKRSAGGAVIDAGESRFVFGVLTPTGGQTQFTVIFEYGLAATSEAELNSWIGDWHNMGTFPFSGGADTAFNDAMIALTDRFTKKNANPLKPNGSALNQLRTNEIALAGPWELREFNISAGNGQLFQVTVKDNPDLSLKDNAILAQLINDNEAAVLTGKFVVPESIDVLEGGVIVTKPILGANSINNLFGTSAALNPAGVNNPEARHKLSLNTCMGCHGGETGVFFLHINPRTAGIEARLSSFLTGIGSSVTDPVNGVVRQFNELDARQKNFECMSEGTNCPP